MPTSPHQSSAAAWRELTDHLHTLAVMSQGVAARILDMYSTSAPHHLVRSTQTTRRGFQGRTLISQQTRCHLVFPRFLSLAVLFRESLRWARSRHTSRSNNRMCRGEKSSLCTEWVALARRKFASNLHAGVRTASVRFSGLMDHPRRLYSSQSFELLAEFKA